MDAVELIRGTEPVSEHDAWDIFELLVPLVAAAPTDPDTVAAASSVISRMPRESPTTALADWWFVTTTAAASPLGLAFHLPDAIDPQLREAMDAVTALTHTGLDVPAATWVRHAHELAAGLDQMDDWLTLESYGKVALPKERDVWKSFTDTLAPATDALRSAHRTDQVAFDDRNYHKALKAAGVDEGSRRWNEMVKRALLCVDRLNELIATHKVVAPWVPRQIPATISDVPADVAALGPVAVDMVATVLTVTPEPDHTRVAELLEQVAQGRGPADLSWLAAISDEWVNATGVTVAALAPVHERRRIITNRISDMRAGGLDADDAELMLLDHDLDGADGALATLDARRKTDRRAQALASAVAQLHTAGAAGTTPDGWDERLAAVDAALADGQLDDVDASRHELERDLRAARRSGALAELAELRTELEHHGAPATLLLELDEHLICLEEQPERAPDVALTQRSRERFESIRNQRRTEATKRLAGVRDALDSDADLIPPDALASLELRFADAEQRHSDGNTMGALELLDGLVDALDAQRVHRWNAAEGEEVLVRHVVDYCTQQVHFEPDDVRRLYVAAKTKPFVILAGLTGSGKSTIARLFAAGLGADARNGRFQRVAVRPDWIDQSEVLGTVNPLSNRFEPGWLAVLARQCERNPDQMHVALLDEMNLAPVEQYLAEYLSALEEARSGSERTRLPLYSSGMEPLNADEWPESLTFPPNLIVIGTVNVDETTRVLSDRVLDRANVLQLSVAVSDAHHRPRTRSVQPWHVPFPEWDSICHLHPDDAHHEFLVEVADLLQGVGIGVGQRAHVELERFVTNAAGILTPERSLDLGVLQRIVPKIRGFKRDLVDGLTDLHDLFESAACHRSAAVIGSWLDDRVSDDEYLDGTDARIGLLR